MFLTQSLQSSFTLYTVSSKLQAICYMLYALGSIKLLNAIFIYINVTIYDIY